MSEKPRDWDRELADIDKIIATGAPAPSATPAARGSAAPAAPVAQAAARPSGGKAAIAGTWFRVVLALALLAALIVWPFAKWCGTGLMLYLGATALGVVTSIWAIAASWQHRRGFAHLLGVVTLFSTLVLGALELLPRIGYARATATWLCTVESPVVVTPSSAPVPAPGTTAPSGTLPLPTP